MKFNLVLFACLLFCLRRRSVIITSIFYFICFYIFNILRFFLFFSSFKCLFCAHSLSLAFNCSVCCLSVCLSVLQLFKQIIIAICYLFTLTVSVSTLLFLAKITFAFYRLLYALCTPPTSSISYLHEIK